MSLSLEDHTAHRRTFRVAANIDRYTDDEVAAVSPSRRDRFWAELIGDSICSIAIADGDAMNGAVRYEQVSGRALQSALPKDRCAGSVASSRSSCGARFVPSWRGTMTVAI